MRCDTLRMGFVIDTLKGCRCPERLTVVTGIQILFLKMMKLVAH
jgi:hypothetical protein